MQVLTLLDVSWGGRLGIASNLVLALEVQVSSEARSSLVRQQEPFLDWDSWTTVVRALVTLQLDYCNAFYVGILLELVLRL